MSSPTASRRTLCMIVGVAMAIPMRLTSALAEDYPAMEAPPDYVEQQNERQRNGCMLVGNCDGPGRPAPPPLPDVWGAVAVSPSTLSWGTSWNYKEEAAASQNAMSRCRASGASDCKVAVTVADVCVSLATSPGQKIFAIGRPIGAANYAEDAALIKCKRAGGQACAVTTSFCADGVHHVVNGHTAYSNGNPIFVPNGPSSQAAGDDTARFYGSWTASSALNGQQVTVLSVHNAQGYSNFIVAPTGNIPAGNGSFSAANGQYATSAEKPNDSGSYRFLNSETVECTNAAGQTVTWKRQGRPVEANVAPNTLPVYAPPQRPGNLSKK